MSVIYTRTEDTILYIYILIVEKSYILSNSPL